MDILGLIDVPIWLLLIVACFSLLMVYGYYPMDTWRRLGVPGPPPLPFIGNMHQFLNPRIGIKGSVQQWQAKYGKVFGIYYFRKPCLVITDPNLYDEVFIKEFSTYSDRFVVGEHFYPKSIMNGISFQKGADWKRVRSIMTPVFTTAKLKTLMKYINNTARNLTNELRNNALAGKPVLAKEVFSAYSLDNIAGLGFGLDVDSQSGKNNELFKHTIAILTIKKTLKLAMAMVGMFPFTGLLFQKLGICIFNPESITYFEQLLRKLVDDRRHNQDGVKTSDFLQYLLDAEAEVGEKVSPENRKLTPEEIVYQGLILLIGGYETTASSMQFIAYLLAQHKDVQDKVRQEIKNVLDGAENDEVSYEHCQQLKYMEAVIYESMRLYPTINLLKREASRDTTFNGFTVPKGTGILVTPGVVNRNPEIFHDPDSYVPDRFLGDSGTKQGHFHPFGQGPRKCIAYRLAMLEMKVGLVHVLKEMSLSGADPLNVQVVDYTGLLASKDPISLSMTLLTSDSDSTL